MATGKKELKDTKVKAGHLGAPRKKLLHPRAHTSKLVGNCPCPVCKEKGV